MILVGTSHIDLQGPERLEHLLEQIQPKIITVEISANLSLDDVADQIIEGRATQIQRLKATDMYESYKRLLTEIYSIRAFDALVPIQYARANGVEIYPVDFPSQESKAKIFRNEDKELLAILTSIYGHRLPYDQYRKAFIDWHERMFYSPEVARDLARLFNIRGTVEDKPAEEREQFMAERILEKNPDVHLGGLAHVIDEPPIPFPVTPLYLRLGDRVSQRIRLNEVSKLYTPYGSITN